VTLEPTAQIGRLHPFAPPQFSPTSPLTCNCLTVATAPGMVEDSAKGFATTTAPGPMGLHATHLQECPFAARNVMDCPQPGLCAGPPQMPPGSPWPSIACSYIFAEVTACPCPHLAAVWVWRLQLRFTCLLAMCHACVTATEPVACGGHLHSALHSVLGCICV
jgi:hypothetical protein